MVIKMYITYILWLTEIFWNLPIKQIKKQKRFYWDYFSNFRIRGFHNITIFCCCTSYPFFKVIRSFDFITPSLDFIEYILFPMFWKSVLVVCANSKKFLGKHCYIIESKHSVCCCCTFSSLMIPSQEGL